MNKKGIIATSLAVLMTFQFAACGNGVKQLDGTQQPEEENGSKIQIVFEYQDGHINSEFESTLESLFNVDIVMDLNSNSSRNAYLRLKEELTHDMAPDLVLCENIKHIDDEILAEYIYDLGSESFVNNYYLNAIEACTSSDGGLYYIPGPSYVYGIVYDKTVFSELGLSVPTNYSEFKELIHKVDNMGLIGREPDPDDESKTIEVPVRAFVPTMRWCDMFQIIFNTMNYEDSIRGISNAKWLKDYQNGKESMVGHMEEAAQKYLQMFEDGVLSLDLWNVKPGYRSQKLYNYHTSLMNIECQHGYEFNKEVNKDTPENSHEMGMMPIYTSDDPDSGYLYAIPRNFISITKQGAKDEKKLEVMLEIMDYLSTPEGQKLLINGSDYFGFLKDDILLDSDFYSDVIDTIEDGRIITTFYYEGDDNEGMVETYLHGATPDLVNGNITVKEWLEGADSARDEAILPVKNEIYGTASETLTPLEAAYIDGLAYLNSMDADIGYVPVAANYGVQNYLYSGDITDEKLSLITAEMSFLSNPVENDMDYVVVEMTGQELLEHALESADNGMAAFAGLEMTYSMSGENGGQYVSLKIDGQDIDMSKTYKVASIRGAVPDAKVVQTYKDLTFRDILKSYIKAQEGIIIKPKQLTIIE